MPFNLGKDVNYTDSNGNKKGIGQAINEVSDKIDQLTYNVNSFAGATDDEKIVNAFNFMNGLAGDGATLYFPSRSTAYTMSSNVEANGKWDLKMDKEINYTGTSTAITIKNASRRSFEIRVRKSTNYAGWFTDTDSTSQGVVFDNVNWCEIILRDIRGFYENVVFDNSEGKGSCYNNVFIGMMYDSFINLYIKQEFSDVTGNTSTWTNQNQFIGGAIKNSGAYRPVKTGSTFVKNEGNNNTFLGTALEGGTAQYSFHTISTNNQYINCRFEQNVDDSLYFGGSNCRGNIVIGGYELTERILDAEKPENVLIIGNGGLTGLYNSYTHPDPVLEGYTTGSSAVDLIRMGQVVDANTPPKKTMTLTGDGKLSLYHNTQGEFPQIELHGRYGQILFGYGNAAPITGVMVDTNPATNLVRFENWNYELRSNSSLSYQPTTLGDGTTTIDLSKGNVFKTANTTAVSINGHIGGREGKPVYIVAGDANTTLVHGSAIKLKGGVSRLLTNGEVVHLLRISGVLTEV